MAPLGVSVGKLRETLDALRSSLSNPASIARPAIPDTLALDYDRVLRSLYDLTSAFAGVDLDARRALSSVRSPSPEPAEAGRLRELLPALSASWRRRVDAALGAERARAAARLLRHPAPDLLGVLGRRNDENAHSDVLLWMLDPRTAPSMAPRALVALAGHLADPDDWRTRITDAARIGCVSVRREFTFGREWSDDDDSLDRIDLVVSGPGFLLAIENKIWSPEHDGQTDAYWAWLSTLPKLRAGLFLTPAGIPPACCEFRALSYLELFACLLDAAVTSELSGAEESVLAGYTKTLAARILRTELRAVHEEGNQ